MAYTEAGKRAAMRYKAENRDLIRFEVRKGEKDVLKEAAANANKSMAQYIIEAINDKAGKQLLTPAGKGA